ncbi:MAG: hypothetical protein AAFM92_08940 [Pseudomonadota bacterium]
MSEHLKELVERAKRVRMTSPERQAQRVSFAFGTANIENEDVTREMVEEVVRKLEREG